MRKTAELHQDELNSATTETVKRKMYVDDLTKSLNDAIEATNLVSQLRKLLEKGGFRLTKWYSNCREVMATIPSNKKSQICRKSRARPAAYRKHSWYQVEHRGR